MQVSFASDSFRFTHVDYEKQSNRAEVKMSNNTSSSAAPAQVENTHVNAEAIGELVPMALLIIIANGLVLILFARKKQLRTPPNDVLFSLAFCDFMTGVMIIPLFIIVVFTPVVTSSEVKDYLSRLVGVLNNLSAISTCYHILAATTEKYLSIIWPVTHRMISKKTVKAVLGVVWAVPVIVVFIPFAWMNMEDSNTREKLDLGHVIFCLIAVFLLPYSFMIYAFVVIFKWISNKGKVKSKVLSSALLSRQANLEKRCLILFASMATVYLVCWLPWFILMLLYKVYKNGNELRIPSQVIVLVRYATSIVNPVLYTFFRRDFKTALKSLFRKGLTHSETNLCGETAETAV